MNGVWRTGGAGKLRTARTGYEKCLIFRSGDCRHGQGNGRVGYIDNHVDAIDIEPFTRDSCANIGLVLMIRGYDVNLEVVAVSCFKILYRHLCSFDRPVAAVVLVETGHISQDTNRYRLLRLNGVGHDKKHDARENRFHAMYPLLFVRYRREEVTPCCSGGRNFISLFRNTCLGGWPAGSSLKRLFDRAKSGRFCIE